MRIQDYRKCAPRAVFDYLTPKTSFLYNLCLAEERAWTRRFDNSVDRRRRMEAREGSALGGQLDDCRGLKHVRELLLDSACDRPNCRAGGA